MKKKVICILVMLALIFSATSAFAVEINVDTNLLNREVIENGETDIMPLSTTDTPESIAETPLVSSMSTLEGNRFISQEVVDIHDTYVNGNLIIFAQKVNLQNITVDGDVVITGEEVLISNFTVLNGATAIAGQNDVTINGLYTSGNVYTLGKEVNATLSARGFYVVAEDLEIGTESEISNVYNLQNYMSEDAVEVEVEPEVVITHRIYKTIVVVIKTAIVAGFIFLYSRSFINRTKTDKKVKYIALSTLKGLGWAILIPFVALVLLCTGVTIGLSFVVTALYVIIFWACVPILSIALMNMFTAETDSNLKKYGITVLIGLVIAILTQVIPLLSVLVAFAGLGILMGTFKKARKELNGKCEDKEAQVKSDTEEKEQKVVEAKVEEPIKEAEESKEEKIEDNKSEEDK